MSEKASRVAKLGQETFMFVCMDGPDTAGPRAENLFGHLDHIEANNQHIRVAGPMRNGPDQDIVGSFFLIAADTEEEAWEFMRGDPYIASNMYGSITVHQIVPACGEWMGGVIWDQDEIRGNMKKYAKG